jgi:hypothetical protein
LNASNNQNTKLIKMQTENVTQVEVPVPAVAEKKKRVWSDAAKANAAKKRAEKAEKKAACPEKEAEKKEAEKKAACPEKEAEKKEAEKKAARPRTPESQAKSAANKALKTQQAVHVAIAALCMRCSEQRNATDDADRIRLAQALTKAVATDARAQKRATTLAAIAAGEAVEPVVRPKRNISFLEASGLPGIAVIIAPVVRDEVTRNLEPEFVSEEEPEEIAEPEETKVVKKPRKQMTEQAKKAAADKRADKRLNKIAATVA